MKSEQTIEYQQDTVVIDKETRTGQILDVALPAGGNIKERELEKIHKYQDLRLQIWKCGMCRPQ